MPEITSEDVERVELLEIVSGSKTGLKVLSKEQLERLYKLVEDKDYTNNIETEKSKKNLLEKIDNRLYDLVDGRVIL
jgi:Holliday junction resolvasome RuvABC DNA-binding subunit